MGYRMDDIDKLTDYLWSLCMDHGDEKDGYHLKRISKPNLHGFVACCLERQRRGCARVYREDAKVAGEYWPGTYDAILSASPITERE